MSHLSSQKSVTTRLVCLGVLAVSIGIAFAIPGYGQSPEEHAEHHPGQDMAKDKVGPPGMAPGSEVPAKGMGGGMEGMEKMMEGMGKAPPK